MRKLPLLLSLLFLTSIAGAWDLRGHSTGGLTVALYGALKGKDIQVNRIVTDSPFLAWNFSSFMRHIAIPVVGFYGKIFKNTKIKQSHCDGYAHSLLKEYYGEWTYNTDWKMIYSPPSPPLG